MSCPLPTFVARSACIGTALFLTAPTVLASTIVVTTFEDVENSSDGLCSLREAVGSLGGDTADSTCKRVINSTDLILLSAGTYCLSSALAVDDAVSIRGSSSTGTVLDAGNGTDTTCAAASEERVVEIGEGLTVKLERVTVQGGISELGGAGMLVGGSATLSMSDVIVRDNLVRAAANAVGGGGMHIVEGATVSLATSEVTGNTVSCPVREVGACARGGGILTEDGVSLTIHDSTVAENTVSALFDAARGGGIYLGSDASLPSSLVITDSIVSGNSVDGDGVSGALGGGIAAETCELVSIEGTLVEGNSVSAGAARAFGGGIYVNFCDALEIETTTIRGNTTEVSASGVGAYGGGVYISSVPSAEIIRATVSGNESAHTGSRSRGDSYGGGVYVHESTAHIVNTTISGNRARASAKGYGGALFAKGEATVYLVHATIANNEANGVSAAYGGGLGRFPSSSTSVRSERIVLLNSVLSANSASGSSTPKGDDCYDKIYTLGNNVLSEDDNCYLDSSLSSSTVTDYLDADPALAELSDSGGPVETHSLESTSAARGIASCVDDDGATVSTDARGVRRDLRCDSGAWEYSDRRSTTSSLALGISDPAGGESFGVAGAESDGDVSGRCATAPGRMSAFVVAIGVLAGLVRRRG